MAKTRLLHRVSVQDQLIAADAIVAFDLAVHPLSVVCLVLRPLNETATLGNYARLLQIAGALNRISVLYRGSAIFSMSGRDAVALNYYRHGFACPEANADDVDNDRRAIVLPVFLGRWPYDDSSCFPASKRGELTLELDVDIADTGYDGLRLSVETIELPGATPKEFERKTTITQTFAATGDNDVILSTGQLLRGLLLFGTTGFAGAAPAPSWGRISVFVDGEQLAYASTDFEVAQALTAMMGRQAFAEGVHTHRVNAASVATTEETGGPIEMHSGGINNYCYLDLDPTRDDSFSLDLRGVSNAWLRANAETADLVRAITVERILSSTVD